MDTERILSMLNSAMSDSDVDTNVKLYWALYQPANEEDLVLVYSDTFDNRDPDFVHVAVSEGNVITKLYI